MDLRAPLHGVGGSGGAGTPGGASTHQSNGTASPGGPPSAPAFDALFERLVYHDLCRMYAASRTMELGAEARFTGLVLFHRYVRRFCWMVHQKRRQSKSKATGTQISKEELNQMKRHLGPVAAACLFLGCKMEEEPRRIRDVLNLSHLLNFSSWDDDASIEPADGGKSGETQSTRQPVSIVESAHPPPLDESYWKSKEQMVSTEQHVLRTIQFDTTVSHPHRCVLIVMETLGFGVGKEAKANDNETNWLLTPDQSENVVMSAWRILNEAPLDPRGTVLEFPTVVTSCAAISLAAEGGIGCDVVDEDDEKAVALPECWWRALDVETKDITKVRDAMQIMLQ
ncbi:hypothetical protein ACHAXT_003191 [Thalassiosira profunda]